jgi:hypothetical protein
MATQEVTGLVAASDYKLTALILATSDGQTLDIKPIMLELNIYEDIFSPVMTGDVTLGDAGDIISSYKMHGNEYISIVIDKPTLDKPIKKIFRIYKISDRKFGTSSLQNYTLHFCSEELILSTQTLLSKSYKGLSIDTMIKDILNNKLKVNPDKMKGIFSTTTGKFDLIIPRMQPLEAIQWLTPRAYNQNENLFFFFENRDGFNFTSYENLISKPVYATYSRSVKVNTNVDENFNSLNFISVTEDFDIIKSMKHGSFSSSLSVLDLVTRKIGSYNFNAKQVSTKGLLNKNIPANDLKNRLGHTLYDTTDNMLKFIVSSDSDPTVNPADIKNWLPQTATRLGQINSFKVVISIPGDIFIKVGNVVNLVIQKMTPQKEKTENDVMRSGKYFVSSVHHIFVQDISTTVLELLSDSVNVDLPGSQPGSEIVSKLIKA